MRRNRLGSDFIYLVFFAFLAGMVVSSGVASANNDSGSFLLELSYMDNTTGIHQVQSWGGALTKRTCEEIWVEVMNSLEPTVKAELYGYNPASTDEATLTLKGGILDGTKVRPFEIFAWFDYRSGEWVKTFVKCP